MAMASIFQSLAAVHTEQNILGPFAPVLKILSMCAVGSILAHPKIRVMNHDACKILSKLVFALFLPCLIFTELGKSVTLKEMAVWWFVPINVLLSNAIGCFFGWIVALICRPPPQFCRLTIVLTGIGNTGNIPLAMVASICHGWNPFGDKCNQRGVAYISFGQWVAVIIVYVFVYHMLEPPREFYELVSEDGIVEETEESSSYMNLPPLLEAEWPGVKDAQTEHTKTPFLYRIFRQGSFMDSFRSEPENEKVGCMAAPRVARKIRIMAERTPLHHIFQPPTVASLLAIILGSISATRAMLFTEDAPFGFVMDSLTILGDAMVPCIMLVLGGMLAGGPGSSELGLRTTIGICVTRLVILPLVGIGVVAAAAKLGFLIQGGGMYRFVLLLQHSMPSSILCGAMTSLRGYGEKEASSVLFWQHIFAVATVAAYATIYFKVVFWI